MVENISLFTPTFPNITNGYRPATTSANINIIVLYYYFVSPCIKRPDNRFAFLTVRLMFNKVKKKKTIQAYCSITVEV